jgi:hypothetical protein
MASGTRDGSVIINVEALRANSPPFAVLVCLTIWNNPVKPMTTSRDFATATFCPGLWMDPHYPY